jgi:hypothetical protein
MSVCPVVHGAAAQVLVHLSVESVAFVVYHHVFSQKLTFFQLILVFVVPILTVVSQSLIATPDQFQHAAGLIMYLIHHGLMITFLSQSLVTRLHVTYHVYHHVYVWTSDGWHARAVALGL